ncbi:hypothetical protein [Gilvibacter sediminis]|uniref:hypothetical protein n=1 Tax=Gilvibacter sediminis TaxID=379071 RepID=UPI0023510586|nr:hypothetical protein [Gilvibacter sediminis]MDC7999373.1 hypothetical protein [Gilvibacter sediminis]
MIVFLLFLICFALFALAFELAKRAATTSAQVAALGEQMLEKKELQYAQSKLFSGLRKAIDQGQKTRAFWVIFPLMLIKSAAFYFIGYILILPILLLIQGVLMGSLFVAYQKRYWSTVLFVKVTYWQLASHLILGAYGFLLGMDWLFEVDWFAGSEPLWLSQLYGYIVLSIIWSVVAAYFEVMMLVKDRSK